jgi:hypothetical protein
VEEEHVGGVKGGWAREERGRVVFALESREVGRVVVEPQQRVVIKVVQVKVAIEDGELATAEVKGDQANGASTDRWNRSKKTRALP